MSKRPDSTARQIARTLQILPSGFERRPRGQGFSVARYVAQTDRMSRPIVAAAQALSGPNAPATRKGARQPWQDEAWALRAHVGEFRFIGDRAARAASRATLFIARRATPGDEPVRITTTGDTATARPEDTLLTDLSTSMFGDGPATAQAIKRAAQHLCFNGETNLRVSNDDTDGWALHAHSVQELTGQPGQWKINDGLETKDLDDNSNMLIRAWIPDPERGWMPDCAARSVLPTVREVKALGQHVGAQVDSRLSGAGIFLVPEELTVVGGGLNNADDDTDGVVAENYDPLVEELMDSMLTPLQNPESAAATVPLILRGPAEYLDKVRHLTFSTPLDENLKDLRDEAIRRIALGMDSAPEILMGTGSSSSHWGAWQVAEEEVAMTIAPLLATICHALTVGWLQPLTATLGLDPSEYIVWFDTTPLELRPDRSKDAQTLFDKGVVNAETVRRENGFTEKDAPQPDDQERVRALLQQVLMSNPGGFVEQILPLLGGPDGIKPTQAPPAGTPGVPAAPGGPPGIGPAPKPVPRPERALPETRDEEPTP